MCVGQSMLAARMLSQGPAPNAALLHPQVPSRLAARLHNVFGQNLGLPQLVFKSRQAVLDTVQVSATSTLWLRRCKVATRHKARLRRCLHWPPPARETPSPRHLWRAQPLCQNLRSDTPACKPRGRRTRSSGDIPLCRGSLMAFAASEAHAGRATGGAAGGPEHRHQRRRAGPAVHLLHAARRRQVAKTSIRAFSLRARICCDRQITRVCGPLPVSNHDDCRRLTDADHECASKNTGVVPPKPRRTA